MNSDEILYTVSDGVATVTLNRPEQLNAWTPKMEELLRDLMTRAATASDAASLTRLVSGESWRA